MNPYNVAWMGSSVVALALGGWWVADALRARRHNRAGPANLARRWIDRGWLALALGFAATGAIDLGLGILVALAPHLPATALARAVPLGLVLDQDVMLAGVAILRYCRERAYRALPPDPPA